MQQDERHTERAQHATAAPRLSHLPALDGIRGAAVIAVLLFHARYPWARGGFLGVTVFFVLSGFLITGLLVAEHDATGSIDLRHFWVRRARRLAPAVLVLVALVLCYVAFGTRYPAPGLLGDGLASLAWVANWRFVLEHQTYASLFADPTPFQHMWSLAVEEQFYLVLPLVATLLLGRRRDGPGRARLAAFAIAAIVGSTLLAAWLHPSGAGPGRAYYGTDARVAEPLVGVVLALLLVGRRGRRTLPHPARVGIDVLGVGGIVGLVVMTTHLTERADLLYRGGLLTAALCAAFVIAAASQPGTVVAKVLSLRPLAALGKISYGVYLFHWPIFLWLTPLRTGLDPTRLLTARLAATLSLATLSYVAVERPVRWGRITDRIAVLGWADVTVGLVGGLTAITMLPAVPSALVASRRATPAPKVSIAATAAPAAVLRPATRPARPGASAPTTSAPLQRAATVAAPTVAAVQPAPPHTTRPGAAALEEVPKGPPPPPPNRAADGTSPPKLKVMVVGDSMADDLAVGLAAWAATQDGVAVYDLATRGCPLSLGGGSRRLANGQEIDVHTSVCSWWGDPSSDRSKTFNAFNPDVVVLQDGMNELMDRKLPSWSDYRHTEQPQFDSWLLNQYTSAVKTFTARGAHLVLLNAVCASWERMGGGFAAYQTNKNGDLRVQSLDRTTAAVSGSNVRAADFNTHICPNGSFNQTVDGVDDARPDGYHLSQAATDAVADKWLGPLVLSAKGAAAPLGPSAP